MKRSLGIDLHRGLAVVLMIMHHTLDSWVQAPDRSGALWGWLRVFGGVPAPAFTFLAGVSAALVLDRERTKGVGAADRAKAAVRRGLYVLGIAFAYRLFSFLIWRNPWSQWESMFRVDILNCMGVALLVVGGLTAVAPDRRASIVAGVALALFAFGLAPFLSGKTVDFPTPILGGYIAGPMPRVLFPLFPWMGFVAAGLVAGEAWVWSEVRNRWRPAAFILAGVAVYFGARTLWDAPFTIFPPHDPWTTGPGFFVMRLGAQLAILGLSDAICRYFDPAPVLLLGRHSLVAYLFHLELVYGGLAYALKGAVTVPEGLLGTLAVTALCWLILRVLERREKAARQSR